jgi:hypothetical protein
MADRRVTYLLTLTDKASPALAKVTTQAQAATAALQDLTAAQTAAAGSLAGLGRARVQAAVSGPAAAPAGSSGATGAAAAQSDARERVKAEQAVAKAERERIREAKAAERDLARQRAADVRQTLGNIAGRAQLEREEIDRVEERLRLVGKLGAAEQELLNRRRAAVAADAESQRASLASRGVNPDAAFGARGTRSTTIGSGVLSGFFDQLFVGGGQASKTLDDIRDSAGRADTSLKTLAGALGVVSPGAGQAATAAGDLVGSLEVLLTPAGATVGVLAGVAAGLAAAGAAAVASVTHIAAVADELQALQDAGAPELIAPESVEGVRDAAAAVEALSPAFSALVGVLATTVAPAVEDFATSAIAAVLLIRKGIESADLVSIFDHLGASIVKTVTLPIEGALRAVAALAEARNSLQESLGLGADPLMTAIASGARTAVSELEAFQVRAGKALVGVATDTFTGYAVGLRAFGAEARAEAEALVDAARAVGKAKAAGDAGGGSVSLTDELSTSVAEVESSAEDAATAIERLRAIIADRGEELRSPWDELRSTFAEARLELAGLTTAAGPAGAALAGAAGRAIDAAEARRTAELVGAGVEAANREIAAADAERRAQLEARAARPGEVVDRFGAAVGALERGNVVGALGAATGIPQVQVVGAALDALATLGELGEDELRQRGEDFARAVAAGLEVLPGLIIDIAPDLALALAEAVGDALLDLPDRIAEAIYEAVTGREADTRGSVRAGIDVANEAVRTGDPLTAALVGAVSAIRGDRSRVADDLGSGLTLPPVTGGRTGRGGPVVLSLRGSGVGLAQAIDVDTGPYGRVLGER